MPCSSPESRLSLYFGLLLLSFGLGYATDTVLNVLLSLDGADTLSSYQVVLRTSMLVVAMFRFLFVASRALIARKDAAGKYGDIAPIVRWSYVLAAGFGLVGASVVLATRKPLLALASETDELVPESETALIVLAFGGIGQLVSNVGYAALAAMFQLRAVLLLSAVGGLAWFLASLLLFLFTDLGLVGFSWGYVIGTSIAIALNVYLLYGVKSNRAKYGFRLLPTACSLSLLDTAAEWAREFGRSLSWLWGQSTTQQLRDFLGTLLVVRSGVTNGAVYTLLKSYSGATFAAANAIAYVITIIGARTLGAGDASADYRGFHTVSTFAWRFVSLWGVVMTAVFAVVGRSVVLAAAPVAAAEGGDGASNPYDPVATPPLMAMFALFQVLSAVAIIFEGLLVAAHDFTFVGVQSILAFCVGFLPPMLAGSAATSSGATASLELFFAGDMLFYGLRAVVCVLRWFCVVAPRFRSAAQEQQQQQVAALDSDSASSAVSPCFRGLISLMCMCQPFESARRVQQDLIDSMAYRAVAPASGDEEDSKATRPPTDATATSP